MIGAKAIAEGTVMPAFDPVTLNIIDEAGTVLFSQSVPFTVGMTARQVLEQAFMITQTSAKPDPFIFSVRPFSQPFFGGGVGLGHA
jgi:hypothetical protein